MAYVALAKLHQLYDGYRQALRVAGRELLLLQEEGRLYLIANRCPIWMRRCTKPACSNIYCVAPSTGLSSICATAVPWELLPIVSARWNFSRWFTKAIR